jgi:hypothetical protein
MRNILTRLAATAAVVVGLIGLGAAADQAQAVRPVHGYSYSDVCRNIDGRQTILDVTSMAGRYSFDSSTMRRHDCVERPQVVKGARQDYATAGRSVIRRDSGWGCGGAC